MTAAAPSASLVPVQPPFTAEERLALAGSLTGCRSLTREACTLDLRQFTAWCRSRCLPCFAVRRAGIGMFARELKAKGRARAAVTRRPCTIAGFCKYAVEEELPGHPPAGHALISVPALNGLRVPGAVGAGTGHLGLERGHRALVITRKGGKAATIPLAPRHRQGDRPGHR